MRKVSGLVLWVQVGVLTCTSLGCKNEAENNTNKNDPKSQPLQYTLKEIKKKGCLDETHCAEFSMSYPVLVSASNPAVAENITDEISTFLYNITSSDTDLPLDKALNASADAMIDDFKESINEAERTGEQGRSIEVSSEVLVNNAKIITIAIENYEYLGGAHPNTSGFLRSFNSQTGEMLDITKLVSDTSQLLSVLEKKYKVDKGQNADSNIKELLFEEYSQLPLPTNYAIVPKGIRFQYNDYEVASHAVGPADILVTWEELGALSDKNKWL